MTTELGPPKIAEFPVLFPVTREFRRRRVRSRLHPPPASLDLRETLRLSPGKRGKSPQFRIFVAETGLGESVSLALVGTQCGAFLRRADGRSGLMIPTRRMQCDQKPMVRRMRT